MLSISEQLDVSDTQENLANHSFSVNGDAGLPGRFYAVQADEGRLVFGCAEGQSTPTRPSNNFLYFWL